MNTRIQVISSLALVLMTSLALAATPFKTYAVRIQQVATLDVLQDGKVVTLGRAGKGFALVGSNPTNIVQTIAGCWEAGLVPPDDPPGIMWQALLILRPNGTVQFLEVESTRTITQENLKSGVMPKWDHRVTLMRSGGWERTAAGTFTLWLYEE